MGRVLFTFFILITPIIFSSDKIPIDPEIWEIPELEYEPYSATEEKVPLDSFTQKLKLQIPAVNFSESSLRDIADILTRRSRELDEEGEAINFGFQNKDIGLINITLDAKNITILDVLKKISQLADVEWIIKDERIFIGHFDEREKMFKNLYRISSQLAIHIKNKPENFFTGEGVSFPEGSLIKLIRKQQLVMLNLQSEHSKLIAILKKWEYRKDFSMTAQLFKVDGDLLNERTKAQDLLALPKKTFKLLDTISTRSILGGKSLVKLGNSSLGVSFDEFKKEVLDCSINWSCKYKVESFEFKDKIRISDNGDRLIELAKRGRDKLLLVLSVRENVVDPVFEKKLNADILQPSGRLYLFEKKDQTEERLFLPQEQDEFIKNYKKK